MIVFRSVLYQKFHSIIFVRILLVNKRIRVYRLYKKMACNNL